jgi:hypothetical protein
MQMIRPLILLRYVLYMKLLNMSVHNIAMNPLFYWELSALYIKLFIETFLQN